MTKQQIVTSEDGQLTHYIKRGWFYLAVFIALTTNSIQLGLGYSSVVSHKVETERELKALNVRVDDDGRRLDKLEISAEERTRLLQTINLNLKNHILSSGGIYISEDRIDFNTGSRIK